jgi:hypothetical protein
VAGTTQTAETRSTSIKVWQVQEPDSKGNAVFVHSVASVDMQQKLTGRQEVRYNSLTDTAPPAGYEDVAKAVGVPLAVIALDAQGGVVNREDKHTQSTSNPGAITIPLPSGDVAIGHQWDLPDDVTVNLKDGRVKKVKTRQRFTLVEVQDGIATIRLDTQVLSPIRDPAVEVQIIQGKANGLVRFDIEAGRIISQQTDVDERVNGFQGEASSLHCVTRFTEKLLPAAEVTASRPKVAGPEPLPTK